MKQFVFYLPAFFIVGAGRAFAQTMPADSLRYSKELITIEQQLMDAVATGDTATWDKRLDKHFFIVTEDGSRLERPVFMAGIRPLPKGSSGYIKIVNPKLDFAGNTAVINYVADEYEFISGQKLHTTYSTMDTWLRTGTGWQMIASQVFEVPQLPVPFHVSADRLKLYTGIYQLQDTVTCSITFQNDTLYIQKKGRAKEALLPETESVFFRRSDTRGRKIFVNDEQGAALMLERRNGQDLTWKRVGKP
jgi:hypothetical protein